MARRPPRGSSWRAASTGPRSSPRRWRFVRRAGARSRSASTGPRSSPRRWLVAEQFLLGQPALQRGRGLHRGDGCEVLVVSRRTAFLLQRGRGLHRGDGSRPACTSHRSSGFNGAAVFTAEMAPIVLERVADEMRLQRGRGLHRGDGWPTGSVSWSSTVLQRGRGLHRGDGCASIVRTTQPHTLQRGRGLHRGDGRARDLRRAVRDRASTGPRSSPRRWRSRRFRSDSAPARFNGAAVFTAEMATRT